MLRLGSAPLLILALLGGRAVAVGAPDTGEIDGAPFAVAVPAPGRWNHQILLLAHDRRSIATAPVALDPSDSLLGRTLVTEGWIVATSGYRRNGVIIADALTDLERLRAYLAQHYGLVARTVVLGDGLGGFLAALLAEQTPDLFAGAIAIDPPLTAHESNQPIGLSLDPKIPLVLVATNKGPLAEATAYKIAKMPRPQEDPLPVLLAVARDGRDNVNDAERLAAFRILDAWLETGPQTLPDPVANKPYTDITVAAADHPRAVTAAAGQAGFIAHVTAVDPLTGTVQLDARPADFDDAQIPLMGYFNATFGSVAYRVIRAGRGVHVTLPQKQPKKSFLGRGAKQPVAGPTPTAYRGEWLGYEDAQGFVTLAHNDEDAPLPAGAQPGAPVAIAPYAESDSPRPN